LNQHFHVPRPHNLIPVLKTKLCSGTFTAPTLVGSFAKEGKMFQQLNYQAKFKILPFGTICGPLVYFSPFGYVEPQKSGNPAAHSSVIQIQVYVKIIC
jgi:hypothetical protein